MSNSVHVYKSDLGSFKEEPPKQLEVQEGEPLGLKCSPPDGYPKPQVYWMIQVSLFTESIESRKELSYLMLILFIGVAEHIWCIAKHQLISNDSRSRRNTFFLKCDPLRCYK